MLNKIWHKTDLGRITDYDTIMSDSQAIRYVAEFLHQIGLLGQSHHVDYEDVDASINTPEGATDSRGEDAGYREETNNQRLRDVAGSMQRTGGTRSKETGHV